MTRGWKIFLLLCLLFSGDRRDKAGSGEKELDKALVSSSEILWDRAAWDAELGRQLHSSCHPPAVCCWPPGLTSDNMFLKTLLLLGLIVLGPHVCSSNFVDISKSSSFFAMCVEFAMFQFNQAHLDEYAYKLLWVGRSQRKVSGHPVLSEAPCRP